jgi:hypothetical protein
VFHRGRFARGETLHVCLVKGGEFHDVPFESVYRRRYAGRTGKA